MDMLGMSSLFIYRDVTKHFVRDTMCEGVSLRMKGVVTIT